MHKLVPAFAQNHANDAQEQVRTMAFGTD